MTRVIAVAGAGGPAFGRADGVAAATILVVKALLDDAMRAARGTGRAPS